MTINTLLITGGCGFIGSNFIRYLLEGTDFGGRIVNVDALTYAGNPENLSGVAESYPGRYVFQRADVCDLARMTEIYETYAVDAVCHFAAESHVDRSIKRPDSFIFTNIVGTFNLLEIARRHMDTFQVFHHISTDEVYGSLGSEGLFTEETPYRPNSPYSASKASSDHLVRAYPRPTACPRPSPTVPTTTALSVSGEAHSSGDSQRPGGEGPARLRGREERPGLAVRDRPLRGHLDHHEQRQAG